uniref:Uncharacterized protein n=1 Tax=Varanus komodoensis TaxID=61221 RepID=A0A8D2LCE2_VARKO
PGDKTSPAAPLFPLKVLEIKLGSTHPEAPLLFSDSQLKQMQELERQRDVLLQGLEMVDQVRDWFQRHLLEAQRRQTHMGAESCLLLAKIQEVNLCLKNLLTSPGKVRRAEGMGGWRCEAKATPAKAGRSDCLGWKTCKSPINGRQKGKGEL